MKALKIVAVVLGVLLLLTGVGLLAGSAAVGFGQSAFDDELAKSGFAGPVEGTVTAIDAGLYTVSYTDKQGAPQTGQGPAASGTEAPQVGEAVDVYYSTSNPSQIVILNIPGGGLAGIAGGLRTTAIVCLVVGGILLLVGIIGLVAGRKKAVPAAPAYPTSLPPGQAYPGQPGPHARLSAAAPARIAALSAAVVPASARTPQQPGPPPGYPPQQPGPPPGYPRSSRARRRVSAAAAGPATVSAQDRLAQQDRTGQRWPAATSGSMSTEDQGGARRSDRRSTRSRPVAGWSRSDLRPGTGRTGSIGMRSSGSCGPTSRVRWNPRIPTRPRRRLPCGARRLPYVPAWLET